MKATKEHFSVALAMALSVMACAGDPMGEREGSGVGECPPTGVRCAPECVDAGWLDGMPCIHGHVDPDTCECVPMEELFCGGVAGIQCPEGMSCALYERHPDSAGHCVEELFCGGVAGIECPEGMICALYERHPDSEGSCVPEGDCPLTGIECTPDCGDDGFTPEGAPCQQGEWDPLFCECVPVDDPEEGVCALTGLDCTPDCGDDGRTPAGAPCEKGDWDPWFCECIPIDEPESDCRDSGCPADESCQQCWGTWECMPDYQAC